MAVHEIRLDVAKPLATQPDCGHNRWHPEIRPVLTVQPGEEVVLDTLDAGDAQLSPHAGVEQLAGVNLNRVHPLTGPVAVDGARPGLALAGRPQDPGFTNLRQRIVQIVTSRLTEGALRNHIDGRENSHQCDDTRGVHLRRVDHHRSAG